MANMSLDAERLSGYSHQSTPSERHDEIEVDLTEDGLTGRHLESSLSQDAPMFASRAYQIEMLEESLRQNIIVAMDTGSGKTQMFAERSKSQIWLCAYDFFRCRRSCCAVLRIMAELDVAPPQKMMWFLAPTVDLCAQQFSVLTSHIPAVSMKFLSGLDNVDKWSDEKLWDAVLKGVRVVVSTHRVLYDALTHGFVHLDSLALLVFDEEIVDIFLDVQLLLYLLTGAAHNCVKSHPGSLIMRNFYTANLAQGLSVPSVLGLSASPIINSKLTSLENIESTLYALCRTPNKYRAELALYVNLPQYCTVLYTESAPGSEFIKHTVSLHSLHELYSTLNILEDPYIIRLQAENTEKSERMLEMALRKRKTWCQDQIKSFLATGLVICQELGTWAADYYIFCVVSKFVQLVERNCSVFGIEATEERLYLCELLKKIQIRKASLEELDALEVSDKVTQFISTLPRDGKSRGIAFVKQRATVAVLARLLSLHPLTRGSLRLGTMVGISRSESRGASLKELAEPKEQRDVLQKFRSGYLDLVIATSVLDEGIDVPACNLVVCFDEPENLKTFVQRRGRARMRESKLVLMMPSSSNKLVQWQALEEEMKKIYTEDLRQLRSLAEETTGEEHDGRELRIESTGALLTMDDAVQHLHHFCAVLPANQYVDLRPEFIIVPGQNARVILPVCVDITVRFACAKRIWLSERNAKKDVAFEAYVALIKAGLVNDNLMPLHKEDTGENAFVSAIEKRPSLISAAEQFNPWRDVSNQWSALSDLDCLKRTTLALQDAKSTTRGCMDVWLPIGLTPMPPIYLSLPEDMDVVIYINTSPPQVGPQPLISKLQNETRALLHVVFGWRFPIERLDFVALFSSPFCLPGDFEWHTGNQPVTSFSQLSAKADAIGLIRDISSRPLPYVFLEWLNHKPLVELVKHPDERFDELPEDECYLNVRRLPRGVDFKHKLVTVHHQVSAKPFAYVLPVKRCTVDNMPFKEAVFALMIPFIMRRLELWMVGQALSKTLLSEISFVDVNLVLCAISASSANEPENYQRLEFLGDSLLKLCVTIQLLAEYPLWHEGYLSSKKDRIVANSRLARAALHVGLDRFIITKSFSAAKWRPVYVHDQLSLSESCSKREMSTKVLADVVEALIGAASIDGGMPKALACMQLFLPEIRWQPLEDRRTAIYHRAPDDGPSQNLPPPLLPLQSLVGYTFSKPALLVEAMTHASCNIGVASLERMEFLGDAILDGVIVKALYGWETRLSQGTMHGIRTAMVNADFLAFMCMEFATDQQTCTVRLDNHTEKLEAVTSTKPLPLWKFMRHSSDQLANAQFHLSERYLCLRAEIKEVLAKGSNYPWALLSRLKAEKFYSDIIESLLGALYIDSGSFEECEDLLVKMGIMPYLRRVLHEGVHVLHPKEELGMLAVTEEVKYILKVEKTTIDGMETREYTCEVFVGDRSIVKVGDGVSREEVKTRAAEMAVGLLRVTNERAT